MQATYPSRSRVIVFPPLVPLAGFLLGIVLEKIHPVQVLFSQPVRIVSGAVGMVLFAVGVVGYGWMVRTFKRMRTPIHNARTPTMLVKTGPFRFSRNPMYLFGSIGYLGLSLLSLQLWAAALLVVVVLTLHYGVVLREEEFLLSRFGEEYVRYKARVPRYFKCVATNRAENFAP